MNYKAECARLMTLVEDYRKGLAATQQRVSLLEARIVKLEDALEQADKDLRDCQEDSL